MIKETQVLSHIKYSKFIRPNRPELRDPGGSPCHQQRAGVPIAARQEAGDQLLQEGVRADRRAGGGLDLPGLQAVGGLQLLWPDTAQLHHHGRLPGTAQSYPRSS